MATSDGDDLQPAASNSRTGSYADLARRMDRMETRQDTLEVKVTELTTLVGRVEQNQVHATELATLRFNAVDQAVKTIDLTLERFMGRINAIVAGEVQLPQAAEWARTTHEWRTKVERRLDELDDLDPTLTVRVRAIEDRELRRSGIVQTFGTTKTVLLVLAAFLGPIIAVASLLTR